MSPSRAHRGTIFAEQAEILAHQHFADGQHVLRVGAARLAASAEPGSFAHLQCDPSLPMRRPMSVMQVDTNEGWAEFLYKEVGAGTRALSGRPVGSTLNVLGPIGTPFTARPERPRPLLVGGGVGIPPMVFLADRLRLEASRYQPLVIMGSEIAFPFEPQTSRISVRGLESGPTACMPRLEQWGVASRLASRRGFAGCFDGLVTDLARAWLDSLSPAARDEVAVYACGPTPMLRATADLAHACAVPCYVCLEEFMACAVGGCAGCAVQVQTPAGPAMKRVCVDGPVFDAECVVWGSH